MRSIRRQAAVWICEALATAVPERDAQWVRAARAEINDIPRDGAALLFALDAVRGIGLYMTSRRLKNAVAAFSGLLFAIQTRSASELIRTVDDSRSRAVGIASATGAVAFGLTYLFIAGAPIQMIAVNVGALLLGVALLLILARAFEDRPEMGGAVTVLMSLALFATALGGSTTAGASRWVALGPFHVQPSLILLPMMVVMFARNRSPLSMMGMLIAATALAIQPDRAMAGVLMSSLGILALFRGNRSNLLVFAAGIGAFAVTLARPDQLPTAQYVDQVYYTAFAVAPLAGIAVVIGTSLLLIPPVFGLKSGSLDHESCIVFGSVWLSIILAAALGNYPAPVVGYGGSAILGYLLSLGALEKSARTEQRRERRAESSTSTKIRDLRSQCSSGHFA